MTFAETLTLVAYFFVLIILAVYGWHRYYLVYLYMSNRKRAPKPGPAATYSAEDVLVRLYGETAALTFRLVAHNADGTKSTFRNSGTLLHRKGQWQVITWQATKEPAVTK